MLPELRDWRRVEDVAVLVETKRLNQRIKLLEPDTHEVMGSRGSKLRNIAARVSVVEPANLGTFRLVEDFTPIAGQVTAGSLDYEIPRFVGYPNFNTRKPECEVQVVERNARGWNRLREDEVLTTKCAAAVARVVQ